MTEKPHAVPCGFLGYLSRGEYWKKGQNAE